MRTCDQCGGLIATENEERIAGTMCKCGFQQCAASLPSKDYERTPRPTGRIYRTVDELVDAECSPEVRAGYYRLRAEGERQASDVSAPKKP